MSWLSDFFKPRQDNFVKLLIEQADYAVKGLEALLDYVQTGADTSAKNVGQYETDADEAANITSDVVVKMT
jgi:hypothetical protein